MVVGGPFLHTTHLGSVQLHMKLGGSVLYIAVSDVLYIPNWNVTDLIS